MARIPYSLKNSLEGHYGLNEQGLSVLHVHVEESHKGNSLCHNDLDQLSAITCTRCGQLPKVTHGEQALHGLGRLLQIVILDGGGDETTFVLGHGGSRLNVFQGGEIVLLLDL